MDDIAFQLTLDQLVEAAAKDARPMPRERLARIRDANIDTVERLIRTLSDQQASPELRIDLCWLLSDLDKGFAVPLLAAIVLNPDETLIVRRAAGWALNNPSFDQQSREIHSLNRRLLCDAAEEMRYIAAYGLARSGNWRYAQTVLMRFNDPNETPKVRGMLAEALAYLGSKRAVPDLVRSLEDESVEVRFWAIFALGSIADETVIPALEKLSSDRTMVEGWWTIGREARDAIKCIKA